MTAPAPVSSKPDSQTIRQLCQRRRLTVEPFGHQAWRIHGTNVDILVASLHYILPAELNPVRR